MTNAQRWTVVELAAATVLVLSLAAATVTPWALVLAALAVVLVPVAGWRADVAVGRVDDEAIAAFDRYIDTLRSEP